MDKREENAVLLSEFYVIGLTADVSKGGFLRHF